LQQAREVVAVWVCDKNVFGFHCFLQEVGYHAIACIKQNAIVFYKIPSRKKRGRISCEVHKIFVFVGNFVYL
jgi:hypothetical protein